jgi:tetratricopeptide (TPR) repeat protein
MPDASTTTRIFADAYHEAALECRNTDMVDVARILESLRKRLSSGTIYQALKKRLSTTSLPEEDALWLVVSKLQSGLFAAYGEQQVSEIQDALRRDPKTGESIMIGAYAEGLAYWESEVYDRIAGAHFESLSPTGLLLQQNWKRLHDLVLQSRWVECLPDFKALAQSDAVAAEIRAHFNITIGQVYLYSLGMEQEATKYFDLAAAKFPNMSRLHRAYGEIPLRNRAFDEARRNFLKALSLEEDEPDNYYFLGDSYRDEGNLEAAENWYADAHTCNPLRIDYYSRMISLYGHPTRIKEQGVQVAAMVEKVRKIEYATDATKGNNLYNSFRDAGIAFQNSALYDEAEAWYEQATALEPKWIPAYLDRGYLNSLLKKYDQAEHFIRKAIELAPDCFDGHWALAIVFDNSGQYDKAVPLYLKCLGMRPEWYDSICNTIGVMYDLQSNYPEAIGYYHKALEKHPENTVYLGNLAMALGKSGQTEAAGQQYEALLKADPANPERYNQAADFFAGAGQYDRAIAIRRQLVDLNPADLSSYDSLIQTWKDSGKPFDEEAIRKEALEKNPGNQESYNKLAIYYHGQHQVDLARDNYRKAIELKPDDDILWSNLATLYKDNGQYQEALDIYQQLTRQFPDKDNYWNLAGFCSYQLSDLQKSLEYITKAAELNPGYYLYQDNIGVLQDQLGDAVQAESWFRKALETAPDDYAHFIWNRIGLLDYKSLRFDAALRNFEAAFKLQPNTNIYAGNIALADMHLGNLAGALEYYRIAKKLSPEDTYFATELKTLADAMQDKAQAEKFIQDLRTSDV